MTFNDSWIRSNETSTLDLAGTVGAGRLQAEQIDAVATETVVTGPKIRLGPGDRNQSGSYGSDAVSSR